jgi:hypothetical protein
MRSYEAGPNRSWEGIEKADILSFINLGIYAKYL